MHYLIIVIIIGFIICFQIISFFSTFKKLSIFRNVFPAASGEYKLKDKALLEKIETADDDGLKRMLEVAGFDIDSFVYTKTVSGDIEVDCFKREKAIDQLKKSVVNGGNSGISTSHNNPVLNVIIKGINNYLQNNKGAIGDFHIMKDIVDRNCDAAEEEINTQIPVPLYYGLAGTMVGILVGIGYLVLSGNLTNLLSANGGSGADGVNALMAGVALAMFASIVGILLTTTGSIKSKNAKAEVEKNKNTFLSWIQMELLPELSGDMGGVLEKMTQNLAGFNEVFTDNVSELRDTLGMINSSYRDMSTILDAVNNLRISEIATANVTVYEKLKNCSAEIGQFAVYLTNVNDYVANMRALNDKLDDAYERSRAIENMGEFFRTEIEQIEQRKAYISKAVGTIDATLHDAISRLKENTDEQFKELARASVRQQQVLQHKLEETSVIVEELKNLTGIKEGISNFEAAINGQNAKLDRLADSIEKLVQMKVPERAVQTEGGSRTMKIAGLVINGIIALSCIAIVLGIMTRRGAGTEKPLPTNIRTEKVAIPEERIGP